MRHHALAAIRGRARRRILAAAAALGMAAPLPLAAPARAHDLVIGDPVNVSKAAGNQMETAAAVDPTNGDRMAVASNNDADASPSGIFFGFSVDGGQTWTTRVVAGGSDGLPAACCDPKLAWDGFGNLFLAYMTVGEQDENCALGRTKAVLARSVDGGVTFPTFTEVSEGCIDQPKVAVGPGPDGGQSVWVAYTKNNEVAARGAPITGLGQPAAPTFTTEVVLPDSQLGLFASVAVGPDGEVAIAYVRRRVVCDDTCRVATFVQFNADPDGLGPASFGFASRVTETRVSNREVTPAQPNRGTDAQPSLVFDRSGGETDGRLFLVYVDKGPLAGTDLDIVLRTSDTLGAEWSAPFRVNDDEGAATQLLPAMAFDDATGALGISFKDTRDDAAGGNDDTHVYVTVSRDGGASFHPNVRVTPMASNSATPTGRGLDYGDYAGSAFAGDVFLVAWADNSNSTGDNPGGAHASMDLATVTAALADDPVPPPPGPAGYWLAAGDGGVFAYRAPYGGSMAAVPLNEPIVGIAADPSGDGYWLAGADGGVFALGGARFHGSLGGADLPNPIVGIAPTPDGQGYWLVSSDGAVFAFGSALSRGSQFGRPLAAPVVGMAADLDGEGYWLVAADGGVFAFAAPYRGSLGGTRLAVPVVGMAADLDQDGYWLVAADGGVFAFRAAFAGSQGGVRVVSPVVGMAADPDGDGYWLAGADGGVFAFRAPFEGSARRVPLRAPVAGIAGYRG